MASFHDRETELEMVQRHVRTGEDILARQRSLIERLTERGLPTSRSVSLLAFFQALQNAHQAHLARIQKA
ncbi:MAG: hypothetical protein EOS37_29885 [Mesorhizobium sp.]|nr:MAG: hypothetical protein EOS37_29885 [Mesorhizobium sp.]